MEKLARAFGFYFNVLSIFSPGLAVEKAFDLFQTPRTRKIRKPEQAFYDQAERKELPSAFGDVMCYEMGNPQGKLVVLAHGWESNGASMSGIGQALAEKGFRVVLFDTPGHGLSKESKANLHTMSNHLQTVLNHLAPTAPFSVIGHSFGSIVSAYTLSKSNYEIDQLMFLTAPANLIDIFKEYRDLLRLNNRIYNGLVAKADGILGESLAGITTLDKTRKINYRALTLIHDKEDRMLPFSVSEMLAKQLPPSKLIAFEKIGHYRMLWNQDVMKLIVEIMTDDRSQ